jgi:hypothetical protein
MNWRLQIEGWALHVAHQYRLLSQIRNPFDRLKACGELSRAAPSGVEGHNPQSEMRSYPRTLVRLCFPFRIPQSGTLWVFRNGRDLEP